MLKKRKEEKMVSNIDSILGKLSIDKETFVKAMQSEEEIEIEFSTPPTEFSPDSFSEDENFLTYQRNFAEEQKTAGKEMAIKEARNKYGLDFQGKTMDNLVASAMAKAEAEATVDPNKKVEQYKGDIDGLREQINSITSERDQFKGQIDQIKSDYSLERTLFGQVKNDDNYSLPADDMVALYKMKTQLGFDEGSHVILTPSGDPLKDSLKNPISVENHFSEFTKNYLKTPTGGTGGADETPTGKKDFDGFIDGLIEQGLQPNSPEWNAKISEATKAGLIEV
jgi:hypothetical protein